jgi:hypothetical protein
MKKLLIAWTGILLLLGAAGAWAEARALIMAISAYQGAVPPLKGVIRDVDNAKSIARKMGVKDANMAVYRDTQLTLAGIRKAFDELYEKLDQNDQVFVYFSGHGGRWFVQSEDRCAESVVAVDGEHLIDSEMESRLKKLSEKAEKVIVFFDSCHSGGVATRAIGQARFVPKTWPGAMTCEKPVNVLTRNLRMASKSAGSGANNYIVIASSRDNEVSFDMPERGGVATSAWTECINGAAVDKDGSGGLSAEEIRECAQGKINGTMAGAQGFLPHNVTLTGNVKAVLAFAQPPAAPAPTPALAQQVVPQPAAPAAAPAGTPPSVQPSAPAQAPPPEASAPARPQTAAQQPATSAAPATSTQPAAQAAVPAPAPAAAPAVPVSALATLNDIYNRRDDRRSVVFSTTKPRFRIGKDSIEFALSSSHAGYVYLLMVGSDGTAFDMLFPNALDKDNYIKAGETLRMPRPSWELGAQGPAGKNQLLAIVADAQRDFSKAGLKPAGPFSMISASPATAKDIQLVSVSSASADSGACQDGAQKRTLVVQKRCSNAYGAAMATVEEVN